MASETKPSNAVLPGQPGATRFSTDDLPERDRMAIFRDIVEKTHVRSELDPLPGERFYVHSTVRALPGLFAYWSRCSPGRLSRTREMLSDGNDSLVFSWVKDSWLLEYGGREIPVRGGDAILMFSAEAQRQLLPTPVRTATVTIPRKALSPLLRDFDNCLAHPVPANSPALVLLRRYLDILRDEASTPTPELQQLAVTHVYDLVAVALGATRDAAETARRGGMAAARLQAIKDTVRERLADGDLSISAIAARHGVSPRSLQLQFEREGATFTEFLRDQRLAQAYRMLASPRFDGEKIAAIAFDCGFNDVSYFNRQFRARYGAVPSDVRNNRDEN